MTLREAISTTDALINNEFSDEEKISWISELDGLVFKNIIQTHEDGSIDHFTPYNKNTDPTTELLISEPYSEAYVIWLQNKMDYYRGETDKYNNSVERFYEKYNDYSAWYNSIHRYKSKKIKFW